MPCDLYKDTVYSVELHFCRGEQPAASDITQQVFLKLMTAIGKFKGEAAFSTWLYRLVINAMSRCGTATQMGGIRKPA